MNQGWRDVSLRELRIEYFKGLSPKNKKDDGDIALVPSGAVFPQGIKSNKTKRFHSTDLNIEHKLLQDKDVLFNCGGVGTLGRSMLFRKEFLKGKAIPDSFVLVLRCSNKDIMSEFLFYVLQTEQIKRKIVENTRGMTGITSIKTDAILDFKISLPPLSTQQRIVAILDEVFAAIAKAKANAEQNLKNAKELFDSYLNDLFTELFQTKEKKTISNVAKVNGGYSFKSTDFVKEGKYQVIRMGNVRPGLIREKENPVFIDKLDEKVLAKALLLKNDVIITQTGTNKKRDYGFTVIIENNNYLLNQRIASIRFSDKYTPKFFLYFSWTNLFKDQYFANETGTVGQGNVGIGAITNAEIPFIPVEEQKQLTDRIYELETETNNLAAIYQQKINTLDELKKSVLQKAFSGELETAKVEVFV